LEQLIIFVLAGNQYKMALFGTKHESTDLLESNELMNNLEQVLLNGKGMHKYDSFAWPNKYKSGH